MKRFIPVILLCAVFASADTRAAQAPGGLGDGGGADPKIIHRTRNERGIPRIDVVYRNKRTTDRVEDRTRHARWEWDFGDGTGLSEDDPRRTRSEVRRNLPPGRHTVRARSWSGKGTLLREFVWQVEGGGAPVRLVAETVREVVPHLEVHGPRMWITGRPARYRLAVKIPRVPYLQSVRVTYYPAREFDVVWARPGIFRVQGAAVVRAVYRLPKGPLVIVNTYVKQKVVDVLATSVMR